MTESVPTLASATCVVTDFAVGSHDITAQYNGGNFDPEISSPAFAQTINKASTSTTLTSDTPSPDFGDMVTFSAPVAVTAPGAGAPSGDVEFTANGGPISGCEAEPVTTGTATCATDELSGGVNDIVANYLGDASFAISSSTTLEQSVDTAATSTALTAVANPSELNDSVALTATVSSTVGSPDGNVAFKAGSTTITGCSAVATTGGEAICNTTELAIGSQSLTAVFAGTADYAASTSNTVTQVVNQIGTSTALASSSDPAAYSAPLTFTATVTGNNGTPAGNVAFKVDGVTIGSCATQTLSGGGVATCATANLVVGQSNHPVTAVYLGNTSYAGSTSNAVNQEITPAATTTVVTSDDSTSVRTQPVTFTATISPVSPATATPNAGTVEFTAGGTTITGCAAKPVTTGTATCSTATLPLGSTNIVATLSAPTNFTGSTSIAFSQSVAKADTTTAVTSSDSTTNWKDPVTFTATISPVAPATIVPTSGTVAFTHDGTPIVGCAARTLTAGAATCPTATLAIGDASIVAVYTGNADTNTSTSPGFTQSVAKALTSTSVSSSSNPSVFGENVVYSSTVTSTAGTPTGTVAFKFNGTDVTTCAAQPLVSGTATCTTDEAPLSTSSLTAVYSSDASFGASTSTTLTQTNNAGTTTTALTSAPSPSVFSQAVVFTATVASVFPSDGTPTGTVAFNTISGCENQVLNGSGVATCSTPAFAVGDNSVTATYAGTDNYATSTSSARHQTVNQADTTNVITSSDLATSFSESVVLTATIAPVPPATSTPASGDVEFRDGASVISGCATRAVTTGVATCTTAALSTGSHTLTAVFLGTDSFNGQTSTGITQVVSKADTTAVVTSSGSPSSWTGSVTFTATLSPTAPATLAPTGGTVSFSAGGDPITGCTIRPVTTGTATCATTALPVGDSSIVATFSGNDDYTTSTSSAFTQAVGKAATTTVVVSDLNPSGYSSTVRYTATVSSIAGTPTGTINFKSGGVNIGPCIATGLINGSNYCETNATPTGSTAITVEYSGDGNFATSTSAPLSQVVNAAVTTTAISSSPNPSVFSESVVFTATVAAPSPASLSPTGTVAFGGLAGCESKALSGSTTKTATCTVPDFAVGAHPIVAVYAGTADFATSSSSASDHVVNKADTTTAIVSSDTTTLYSMDVVLTATVAPVGPATAIPSEGVVEFRDGVNPITGCATQAVTTGVATCTTTILAAGSHTLRGAFIASTSFNGSVSSGITQTISQAGTSLTLDTPAGSKFSEPVTLTATAAATAPATGTPTGTVAFRAGGTDISGCAARPLSNGVATCITDALTIGGPSLTAAYAGSTNFLPSTASSVESDVSAADTTVAVTSSVSPSTWSQSVTFTAAITTSAPAVAPASAGTVTFNFEGTPIGACTTVTMDSPGVASCTLTALPVGTAAISAVYNGAPNWTTSTSPAFTQTVNQAATTTGISSNPTESVFGQSVNFQATVSPVAPATTMPTGTLSFKLDGVSIVACTALPFTGIDTASSICPLSTMTVGDHTITAEYSGSTNYSTSPLLSLPFTVSKAATTTVVTSTPNPSVITGPVTITATVAATAPGAGTPTGTVGFKVGGGDVTGCTSKPLTSGVATCTSSSFGVGLHNLSAVYVTSTNFLASTSALYAHNVTKATTSTAVVSSDLTTDWGDPVTFTATVSTAAPATVAASGGSVSFNDDGVAITGCGTKPLTATVATCTTSALEGGDHPITAVYTGDNDHLTSTSPTISQLVDTANTTTVLTSDAEPSRFGQAVTFAADVASTAGTPTGSVNFYVVQRDQSRELIATEALVDGSTSTIRRELPVRMNAPIVAEYTGEAGFGDSAGMVMQTVSRSLSRTLLRSSHNPSTFGQSVTLTATVAAMGDGEGTPKGKVAFYRVTDGVRKWIGTAVIADGVAELQTSKTPVGVSSMIAQYNGNGNFRPSSRTGVQRVLAG